MYSWIQRIKDIDNPPAVLVGNKVDLESSRQVAKSEGVQQANSWRVPFLETSAKTRVNIEEAFVELIRFTPRGSTSRTGANEYKVVVQGVQEGVCRESLLLFSESLLSCK